MKQVKGVIRRPRYLVFWEGGDPGFDVPEKLLWGTCDWASEAQDDEDIESLEQSLDRWDEPASCQRPSKDLVYLWFDRDMVRLFLCLEHKTQLRTAIGLPDTERPRKVYWRRVRG